MRKPPAQGPVVWLGDEEIARRLPFIRRAVRVRRVPDSDMDDLAQHVAMIALLHAREGRFRPPAGVPLESAVERWLSGIARRTCQNHEFKRRRVEVHAGAAPDVAIDPGPTPEAHAAARGVVRVLRRLSRCYREVLALAAAGATAEESARTLGLPVSTVNGRLRVGRAALRRALAPMEVTWAAVRRRRPASSGLR